MINANQMTFEMLCSGFAEGETGYACLFCDAVFDKETVYPVEDRFCTAAAAVKAHIQKAHGGLLRALLTPELCGDALTENQTRILCRFAAGLPDAAVAKELGITLSTVRHQRFVLREKRRQATLLAALLTVAETAGAQARTAANEKAAAKANVKALEEKVAAFQKAEPEKPVSDEKTLYLHDSAMMVDDRFKITPAEAEKILKSCFSSLSPLRLKVFPPKEKKKVVILYEIQKELQKDIRYTEQEINRLLSEIYPPDYVTLRRYLIEYGYLCRTKDCKEYWKP